mgnify:CR=1 FL=1
MVILIPFYNRATFRYRIATVNDKFPKIYWIRIESEALHEPM